MKRQKQKQKTPKIKIKQEQTKTQRKSKTKTKNWKTDRYNLNINLKICQVREIHCLKNFNFGNVGDMEIQTILTKFCQRTHKDLRSCKLTLATESKFVNDLDTDTCSSLSNHIHSSRFTLEKTMAIFSICLYFFRGIRTLGDMFLLEFRV